MTLSPADLNQAPELAHHWWQTLAVTTAGDTAIRSSGPAGRRPTAASMIADRTVALLASARALAALDRLAHSNPNAELSDAADAAAAAAADHQIIDAANVWALVHAHRQGA